MRPDNAINSDSQKCPFALIFAAGHAERQAF
jgi:hypothetical protein